jgi:hypothetical protein
VINSKLKLLVGGKGEREDLVLTEIKPSNIPNGT